MPETTYPGFQNDGAFQLAEDAGFQTQLVTVEAPPPSGGGGVVVRRARPRGRRYRAACEVGIVVEADARTRFTTALTRDDEDVVLLLMASPRPAPRPAIPAEIVAEIVAEDDALGRR